MREDLMRYRIRFDKWFHESSLHEDGYVAQTMELLREGGLTYDKDGATWLRNTALGADKDEVLLRANGFYTYYAVDIAYHRDKMARRGFERSIDVWGADHPGHAVRFNATMSAPALGLEPGSLEFVIMQMVRLTRDGETVKVSKRTGKALTLSDLLDEISVDACRFFFNAKPDTHLEFDLGLAVRQDSENPVYYVQYAHARICSLTTALAADGYAVPPATAVDATALGGAPERELLMQIALLPDELIQAARERDPSRVNRYVVELAARFHRFYNSCRMRGERDDILLARLTLADAARQVIRNCLALVGVTAPERMRAPPPSHTAPAPCVG
jgi:arginyl-tRNA synthetase